jgi:hypothetical protein
MIYETNKKQLKVDKELIDICIQIKNENKNDQQWSLIESCDMYQTKNYCGGYDGIEQDFEFSYYENNIEYWFSFSTFEVDKIINGDLQYIDLRGVNK